MKDPQAGRKQPVGVLQLLGHWYMTDYVLASAFTQMMQDGHSCLVQLKLFSWVLHHPSIA